MSVIWSGVTEEGAVVPVQVTAEGKVVAVGDGPEGEYLKLTGGNLTGDLTIDTDKIALNENGSASFAGNVTTQATYRWGDGSARIAGDTLADLIAVILNDSSICLFKDDSVHVIDPGVSATQGTVVLNNNGSATFASNVVSGGDPSLAANHGIKMTPDGSLIATGEDSAITMYIPGDTTAKTIIYANGSAKFAGSRCGFTSSGELFFTSRNERYKLIVSNGICQAEPYTRQMELKEKAEQFIADKRETKPSGPDPSDSQSEVTTDNDNA